MSAAAQGDAPAARPAKRARARRDRDRDEDIQREYDAAWEAQRASERLSAEAALLRELAAAERRDAEVAEARGDLEMARYHEDGAEIFDTVADSQLAKAVTAWEAGVAHEQIAYANLATRYPAKGHGRAALLRNFSDPDDETLLFRTGFCAADIELMLAAMPFPEGAVRVGRRTFLVEEALIVFLTRMRRGAAQTRAEAWPYSHARISTMFDYMLDWFSWALPDLSIEQRFLEFPDWVANGNATVGAIDGATYGETLHFQGVFGKDGLCMDLSGTFPGFIQCNCKELLRGSRLEIRIKAVSRFFDEPYGTFRLVGSSGYFARSELRSAEGVLGTCRDGESEQFVENAKSRLRRYRWIAREEPPALVFRAAVHLASLAVVLDRGCPMSAVAPPTFLQYLQLLGAPKSPVGAPALVHLWGRGRGRGRGRLDAPALEELFPVLQGDYPDLNAVPRHLLRRACLGGLRPAGLRVPGT